MTATSDALSAGVETSTPPATAPRPKHRRDWRTRDFSPPYEDGQHVSIHHSTCRAKDTDQYPGKP